MRRDSQISLPPADACNAYPRVTGAVIKLAFLWFIAGVVFIGLLVEPISENILVEKAIFGAITIVAGIIYWAVLQVEYFLNRKWWAVGFLAFVGIVEFGVAVCEVYEAPAAKVTIAALAFAALMTLFADLALWSQELVPTSIRSSVLGGLFAINRVGYITGSQLLKLKFVTSSWVSLIIFGLLAIIGALIASTLQDTTKGSMWQTLEEAEKGIRRLQRIEKGLKSTVPTLQRPVKDLITKKISISNDEEMLDSTDKSRQAG